MYVYEIMLKLMLFICGLSFTPSPSIWLVISLLSQFSLWGLLHTLVCLLLSTARPLRRCDTIKQAKTTTAASKGNFIRCNAQPHGSPTDHRDRSPCDCVRAISPEQHAYRPLGTQTSTQNLYNMKLILDEMPMQTVLAV